MPLLEFGAEAVMRKGHRPPATPACGSASLLVGKGEEEEEGEGEGETEGEEGDREEEAEGEENDEESRVRS